MTKFRMLIALLIVYKMYEWEVWAMFRLPVDM